MAQQSLDAWGLVRLFHRWSRHRASIHVASGTIPAWSAAFLGPFASNGLLYSSAKCSKILAHVHKF